MLPGDNKGTQSEKNQFEAAGYLFPYQGGLSINSNIFYFFFSHSPASVLRHCCEEVAAGLQENTEIQGLQVVHEAEDA